MLPNVDSSVYLYLHINFLESRLSTLMRVKTNTYIKSPCKFLDHLKLFFCT